MASSSNATGSSTITAPHTPHHQAPVKIKRPLNCWILFRQAVAKDWPLFCKRLGWPIDECTSKLEDMSALASAAWKVITAEERKVYMDMAAKMKQDHARMYPDYTYRPITREQRDIQREDARVSSSRARRQRASHNVTQGVPLSRTSSTASACSSGTDYQLPRVHTTRNPSYEDPDDSLEQPSVSVDPFMHSPSHPPRGRATPCNAISTSGSQRTSSLHIPSSMSEPQVNTRTYTNPKSEGLEKQQAIQDLQLYVGKLSWDIEYDDWLLPNSAYIPRYMTESLSSYTVEQRRQWGLTY